MLLICCAVNDLMRNSPLLRGGEAQQGSKLSAQRAASEEGMACQQNTGRGPPSPCKFFILDVSDLAQELGIPVCDEVSALCGIQPSKQAPMSRISDVFCCVAY